MWRYRELLPVTDDSVATSLGEGFTPLVSLRRMSEKSGFPKLLLKDESFNPTGSFKARGLSVAVSKARELGVREFCVPTAGNAGGALAAYTAAAGLKAHVYMPEDTPVVNIRECQALGAEVYLVHGLISDASRRMAAERHPGWFDVSTLKEPYRLEGKKTLGFEIAEQLGWKLPDVIVYPTGGGTGLIGMWKAFSEMEELGWIDSRRPRMIAVQAAGCAPIVRAWEQGASTSEFWNNASTIASGLRVPKAFADSLILSALYGSNGGAVSVTDEEILAAIRLVGATEGILVCPEGAATVAAVPYLRDKGLVDLDETVLLFNTGSAFKYVEVLERLRTTSPT
jgi:threonine synthase